MKVEIREIAGYLPARVETNEMLALDNPSWDMAAIAARTGVRSRHIAALGETALDLACRACDALFTSRPEARATIDAIIFCTQSGDYIMPPNSCVLHKYLDLPDNVLAFDFNLACSGYVYGLAIAGSLITSGVSSNILLVTADTYSRYINSQDRSARVLFGDGAAVTIVAASTSDGIVDVLCSTSGKNYSKFIIQAGGCRMPKSERTAAPIEDKSGNTRTLEQIHMDGLGILSFVNVKVPEQIRAILKRNDLTIADIDLFVFHQASKPALDSLNRLLRIPPAKSYSNLSEVGNTVSASIPLALKNAMTEGLVGRGSRVLISGFGVGLSWATAIVDL
jgi:3-oxoacyl-[acyl-carrier-protein] synthase III